MCRQTSGESEREPPTNLAQTRTCIYCNTQSPLATSNCEGVILPRIAARINGKEQEFCPRCECKYENRNTSVIKVVVVMVIWVISLLVVYMLFLILLEPLLNKRVKGNYQEHTNEDVSVPIALATLPTTRPAAHWRRPPDGADGGSDESAALMMAASSSSPPPSPAAGRRRWAGKEAAAELGWSVAADRRTFAPAQHSLHAPRHTNHHHHQRRNGGHHDSDQSDRALLVMFDDDDGGGGNGDGGHRRRDDPAAAHRTDSDDSNSISLFDAYQTTRTLMTTTGTALAIGGGAGRSGHDRRHR